MIKKILLFAGLFLSTTLAAQDLSELTLPSATGGEEFVFSQAGGEFVALHFLLKTECPICIRHTTSYAMAQEELPGVVNVFIKPDTKEEIAQWASRLQGGASEFPIYRDIDAKLADELHIPDGYKFHGQEVHYPALVLLDAGGNEVYRYVGKSNMDRFSVKQLKKKIEELHSMK